MKFSIEKKIQGTLGRSGFVGTSRGVIETPAFVPVGTKATIKALSVDQVKDLGAQVLMANTYHLYLQPGDENIKTLGGLHKFMNWQGPLMTDSGGFQVFSLGAAFGKNFSKLIKSADEELLLTEVSEKTASESRNEDIDKPKIASIDPNGVTFKSHITGDTHYITPEKSIEIQHNLGADIIFAFDECTSPKETEYYQREALDRTHSWARKSLEYHREMERVLGQVGRQALFGVVQGGRHEKLRKMSAEQISSMDFDGFAIGGSFVKEDINNAVRWVNEILPEDKPRHLFGVGEPEDLFMGVENGIDTFDCVAPTRMGRNGTLYTKRGKINIMNAEFVRDPFPIEKECQCYTCINYTRAYVAHLFRAKEMMAATLASIHNLYFIVNLVKRIRQSILDGNFHHVKDEFLKNYE